MSDQGTPNRLLDAPVRRIFALRLWMLSGRWDFDQEQRKRAALQEFLHDSPDQFLGGKFKPGGARAGGRIARQDPWFYRDPCFDLWSDTRALLVCHIKRWAEN